MMRIPILYILRIRWRKIVQCRWETQEMQVHTEESTKKIEDLGVKGEY